MKSRFIGIATFVLAGSLGCFGGQPAKVGITSKAVEPAAADRKPAVQFGKGSGMTRNEVVLRGNAYRAQTPQENSALKDPPAPRHFDSSAFRK